MCINDTNLVVMYKQESDTCLSACLFNYHYWLQLIAISMGAIFWNILINQWLKPDRWDEVAQPTNVLKLICCVILYFVYIYTYRSEFLLNNNHVGIVSFRLGRFLGFRTWDAKRYTQNHAEKFRCSTPRGPRTFQPKSPHVRYSQLISVIAGVDPLALPEHLSLRLQRSQNWEKLLIF